MKSQLSLLKPQNCFAGSLFCIHGFLGQFRDWDSVIPPEWRKMGLDLFSPHLLPYALETRALTLESLGAEVNRRAGRETAPKILVGYSLGGRIALHALFERPEIWAGAVIISAHPGLSNPVERKNRVLSDENWARRFEVENWDELMASWNSQAVLSQSSIPSRMEAEFSREALAQCLRGCSLGKQRDFRSDLQSAQLPILWMVGSQDQKFLQLAREVAAFNPQIELEVVSNASHRAPWDQPDEFARCLSRFLQKRLVK